MRQMWQECESKSFDTNLILHVFIRDKFSPIMRLMLAFYAICARLSTIAEQTWNVHQIIHVFLERNNV